MLGTTDNRVREVLGTTLDWAICLREGSAGYCYGKGQMPKGVQEVLDTIDTVKCPRERGVGYRSNPNGGGGGN